MDLLATMIKGVSENKHINYLCESNISKQNRSVKIIQFYFYIHSSSFILHSSSFILHYLLFYSIHLFYILKPLFIEDIGIAFEFLK